MNASRRIAVVWALALALLTGSVTSASAAARTSTVRASVNHAVLHRGSTASISGVVSPNLAGQTMRLQRFYGGAWHTVKQANLNARSGFAFAVTGLGGRYTYRVYHPLQHGWHSSVSSPMTVTIQTLQSVTVAAYAGTGDLEAPPVRIPTATYALRYRYSCTPAFANYFSVSWNTQFDGFEFLWSEPADGVGAAGTWVGRDGAQFGFFDVRTAPGCTWSFTATYRAWR